jgi:hypothetical protein
MHPLSAGSCDIAATCAEDAAIGVVLAPVAPIGVVAACSHVEGDCGRVVWLFINVFAKDSCSGLEMDRKRLSDCSGESWANDRSNVAYNDGAVKVLFLAGCFVDGERAGSGVPPMTVLSRSVKPEGSSWL